MSNSLKSVYCHGWKKIIMKETIMSFSYKIRIGRRSRPFFLFLLCCCLFFFLVVLFFPVILFMWWIHFVSLVFRREGCTEANCQRPDGWGFVWWHQGPHTGQCSLDNGALRNGKGKGPSRGLHQVWVGWLRLKPFLGSGYHSGALPRTSQRRGKLAYMEGGRQAFLSVRCRGH